MSRPGYDMEIEHGPGVSMITVFLIVLALHVVVIGGALGVNWMRSRPGVAKPSPTEQQKAPVAPEGAGPRVAFRAGGFEPPSEGPAVAEERRIRPVDRERPGLDGVRLAQGRPAGESPEAPPAAIAPAPATEPPKAVASVAAATPAAPAESSAKAAEHVVKKGEMLWGIARKHGVTVAALQQANGLRGDMIRVGQKLKLPANMAAVRSEPTQLASATPGPASPTASTARAAAAPASGKAADRVYVVAKGDTLWGISKRFKVSADRLVQTNKIQDPGRLRVGTKLVIPLDVSGRESGPGGTGSGASTSALAMSQ